MVVLACREDNTMPELTLSPVQSVIYEFDYRCNVHVLLQPIYTVGRYTCHWHKKETLIRPLRSRGNTWQRQRSSETLIGWKSGKTTLMSLYGTEWREQRVSLGGSMTMDSERWFNYRQMVKTGFCQKDLGEINVKQRHFKDQTISGLHHLHGEVSKAV